MQAKRHPASPTVPEPGRYEIDPGRSAVSLRTRHLFGLGGVRGDLAVRAGTVEIGDPVTGSSVHAEIDAASLDTGNPQRDASVRSARFLDTARHPVMTFAADRLDVAPPAAASAAPSPGTHAGVPAGPPAGTLTGTLTVRGVARPVTLTIERADVASSWFTVHATTRVDRTAFGVTAARGLAARHLDVSVRVRCVRAPAV